MSRATLLGVLSTSLLALVPGSAMAARLRVSLTSKPANPTTATDATFTWSTNNPVVSASCTLDGVAAACASPETYTGLAPTSHSFSVKVTDSNGRTASTSYSWSVTASSSTSGGTTGTTTGTTGTTTGTTLWTGDLEEGTLADWYYPSTSATGSYGGGEYDSGSGVTTASADIAHTGSWSQKMTLTNGVGGTRMFRWKELRANRTTTQSAWMYIPKNYTLTGDPNTGKYWILFEFKSRTADNTHNDPFWYVNAYNRSDGTLGAKLAWGYQSKLEGPHQGETGWRNYGDVSLPVGRWFQISATLTQSKDFDGAITVTVDGQQLASVTNVRTGWSNCTYNTWCVEQHWAVTNYSDGILQTPSDIYVDDAQVGLP